MRRLLPVLACAGLQACALATATPPQVEVTSVELDGATPLVQSLRVGLCVTNPNDTELAFRRVRVDLDVAGAPLASSESEAPVRLPPHASTAVPVAVATTTVNLGPQVLALLRTGSLDYRLHGSVQLDGALAITLPFSRSGRLDVLSAGSSLLSDAAAPGPNRCGA